ncbi:MAG: DUF1566 domain-containing protein [Rhodoferax sp.]|nr:DUF1566 domain-containing protein [Rhodoferax sp.]
MMQSTFNLFKALLFSCLLLIAPFAQAAFTINNDGTVTDPSTGLTWMRCSMGQTWDGSTCTGTLSEYTFDQANALTGTVTFAGQSDWRMPNIRELQTIVDRSVYRPAIDSVVFPNTPNSVFRSSSPDVDNSGNVWLVNFGDGSAANNGSRLVRYAVRLVRGGQAFAPLLGITRPTSDYVDNGNGTVTHTPTYLTWMRCAMGQTWTGSTCTGKASEYTFDQANALTGATTFAGQGDWRLPLEDELLSLVDYSVVYPEPKINSGVFPAAPRSHFWSVSPYVYRSNRAWIVSFNYGYANEDDRSYKLSVRLVRGGCNKQPPTSIVGVTLKGTDGDERFINSNGSDTIDGAGGVNTVVYGCKRANFTLQQTTTGWVVSSISDGFDKLSNVQRLQFADMTLALDTSGNAGQAYRIYQAAFNRTPDSGGLKYWIEQMDKGMGLLEVAARFVDSDEFRSLYGTNPANASFLTKLYNNVLHRQPEQSGYDWWLDELNSGRRSQTKALADFSESDENKAGVLPAIQNGIELPN